MKRTFTFLMTALFLCVGITVKAQTFPETSTAEAPKYYTIASFNRGGYLTNVGEGKSVEHVATARGSIWYFTKADENGGLHFCNFDGGYLAADKTISETAGTWYVLANGVNTEGVSISSTNPISGGSCIDANNYNTGVGAWHPSANDWHGTTWVFAEVTDFSMIFNVDEAKTNAKAELDVLASETAIYPDATAAKASIDAIQPEGTSAAQLVAAIDAVNQCVVDYKNAAYRALEGKYFAISTPGRNNLFMNLADERVKGVASVENTLSALWQFQCVDGTVRIFNPATEMYLCEPQGNSAEVLVTASAADAGLYQLAVNASAENPAAKIKFTSNGKSVHMAGHSVLVRWDNGGASEWTVAETVVDITKDIAALLEANAENHAELPALGQYSTEGYNALLEAKNTVTTLKQAAAAVAAFEATKNLPLFTIDSQKDYALGQSIYENEEGALKFKATDAADKSMLWAFDMTATEVGLTDKVVVRNAATGNLFWGASFISVIETEPAVEGDGVFMFKTEGTGSPVHAQANGSSIVRWSSADANAVGGASTWKFAFVGVSNPAAYDLSEVAASFKEQAMAFAGLQENAALSALPAVQEKWAEGMGVVEPLFGAVEEGNLVLKADVVAAMEMMAEIQAVVAYYSETFAAAKDEANAAMDELDEESEEYKALLGAINVSTVTTVTELEAKAEIIAEVLEYLASLPVVDPNDYTSYIINADLATGDAWNIVGTKGIADGMVKVASESAFDFSQTITLPAGQYKMTAKAVYRYTGSEAEEFAAIEAGTKTRLVNLYAETATCKYEADVMNRYDGASDTDYAAGNGSVTVNGKFVPNSSFAVQAWFNNGQYVNELVFNVQEEGQVKIGLTRTGSISGDYTNIGAWTLTRLGDAEVDPNDYTSHIINADLATGDAWNTEGTKGIANGYVKVGSGSIFDFCQTITLPAGQYKMTAKAAYRYGGDGQAEYDAIQAGTDTHLAKLYAATATYKYEGNVMNRYEGASETDLTGGTYKTDVVNNLYVPNASDAVKVWFDNDQYVNELVFNVQEDGEVKIGIANAATSPIGDYTNIGAWTLTRLGDAEADPEVEEPTPDPDPTPDPEEPEETVDLDMTHKVSRDWEGKSGNVTIDGIAMSEKYEGNADPVGDQLWQTVTGLENGKYTVKLWANARVAWVGSPATDGQEELTYIFANNVEKSIAVLLNPHTNGNVLRTLEGVEVTDGTLRMGMKKVAPGSNWHSIQIESLTLHATNEVIANIAKVDLKAALDAANAVSPITDEFAAAIAAAQNVYDNSTDAEEVKAAVTSLKEATKLAILMNATEENPVLTDFVVNGTFDAGTTGWKSTTGAQNQGTATNQQGAFTGAFFENWNGSNYTGKLYQVIENIPNGVYELSICAFVETFDGSAQFVYANADKVALTTGAPTAYTVRTIVKNNTIEVGFEQTAAVNRWCGIDNVSLTYFGEASNEEALNAAKVAFTAAYAEFGVALEACQAMMLKMSFYEIDDAAYQLNEQLETTTDVDALNTMAETLAGATASLKEINEVYADYDVFVQKFKAAAEISEPKTTEAAELLEFNMYGGAGMQAASLEALAQAVETIKADYFTYIANAKLLDGNMFDVTFMIANAAVASKDAWVNGNTAGGEAYAGAPDGQYLDWCNWSGAPATFNMSQEITGLPAGMYTLKAATRSDSRMVSTIYAGTFEAAIHNVGNQGNELGGGWGWTVIENIEVSDEGTLTIGFTGTAQENGVWAGADNFQLYYGGPATDDVVLEIAKAAFTTAYEEFGAALTACQAMMLKMSFYEIDDAAYQLNEQLETTTDVEALNAMVETLAEATVSLKEINEVYAGYDVFVQKFKAAAEISEPKTTEAAELLEFNMYGGAGMQASSLEALVQAVETIKADYFTYIANANLLDGNVFDLTYLIQNPNFDKNMEGWTCVNAGHNGGAGYNNVGGIAEIALWGAESWEASITQTLENLPNGTYVVKMAWMAASGIEMTLSANEGSVTVVGIGDQGGNIANDGSVVEMGQGFRGWQYAEAEADVKDGVLTITVNSSSTALHTWSNADAFELYYAGDISYLYDLDETIEGEWVDVTNAAPGEWAIIDHAELLGLGEYWVATNNTRYDEERGVMEFVAGENAAASLIQEWCPFGQATYRLTGKAFHNGAVNAVMFVGDQTVEIPAAAEGATFENAEEYFTTFSIEFTCESAWGTQLTVGYSCEFDNAEDFLVVGGLKLEEKKSTTIKSIFMETIMACESFGYEIMNMTELHAQQQAVMVTAMPIYEAIMGGQKVLKADVEKSIEDMQAIMAELNPVAEYYKGEFMNALYAAEEFKSTLDEASQAYTDLEAAINEAADVAAVTTVAELEAKVAALEELMRLIETGIDNIETETETVIYDLSGRRVTEMTKGIYIVNGKKVLVK